MLWPLPPALAEEVDLTTGYDAELDIYLMKYDTPYHVAMIPDLTRAANRWLDAIAKRDVEGP